MMLYRGYIKTNGKSSCESFKDKTSDELRTLGQARRLESYAGVLADNTVLIDVDDSEQADALYRMVKHEGLRCRVVQTDHGKHFLFRNDGRITQCQTKVRTAVGLTVDIKVGSKNSYEILKKDGIEREVLDECDEPDQVPRWLTPIRTKKDLFGLGEGDGRNDVIHAYILVLQSAGWGDEDIRKCLELVNHFVFAVPLTEDEFETATRVEEFEKGRQESFWIDGKLQHNVFGDWLINQYSLKRINGRLHMYKDGVYVPTDQYLEHFITIKAPTLKDNQRKEIIKYVNAMICENTETSPPRYIAFKNGIYDINSDELRSFSPDFIITNLIPHEYNSEAYSDVLDKMLDKLSVNDTEVRSLLEELVGYCFYRKSIFRAAFFLTGDGSNGKSTFLSMLEDVLGYDNRCSIDIRSLGERFRPVELFGKLANIADDISDEYIRDSAMFKKAVTGETIAGEFKGQNVFSFTPYATNIYSVNEMPRIKDAGGATTDRMIRVPFDARFSRDDADYDPHIKTKLEDEAVMEYMILLGVQGLKRVLGNNGFTTPKRCIDALTEYRKENDPVLQFFDDLNVDDVLNHSVSEVYTRYTTFCSEGCYQPMSKTMFGKRVRKVFGLTAQSRRLNGKSIRVFVKP